MQSNVATRALLACNQSGAIGQVQKSIERLNMTAWIGRFLRSIICRWSVASKNRNHKGAKNRVGNPPRRQFLSAVVCTWIRWAVDLV
ncbi:unnamed protein product [Thelazia callipaeda]|uniref:Transposase n=1 Tax=Thelazia callipaeda TaxID=103827 RepID=A0A0N5CPZ1_THECL|nr:unnamed protein product [Thelazia callipaeda]